MFPPWAFTLQYQIIFAVTGISACSTFSAIFHFFQESVCVGQDRHYVRESTRSNKTGVVAGNIRAPFSSQKFSFLFSVCYAFIHSIYLVFFHLLFCNGCNWEDPCKTCHCHWLRQKCEIAIATFFPNLQHLLHNPIHSFNLVTPHPLLTRTAADTDIIPLVAC